MINYHENDIGRQLARDAFYGTSHFHERRGDGQIESYLGHMTEVEQEFSQWATDDNRDEMTADLEAYRSKYAQLLRNYLHSHSNVVSAFIAGPANFPATQMNSQSFLLVNLTTVYTGRVKANRVLAQNEPPPLAKGGGFFDSPLLLLHPANLCRYPSPPVLCPPHRDSLNRHKVKRSPVP